MWRKGCSKIDRLSKISSTSTESTVYDDDSFHNDSSVRDQSLSSSIGSRSSLKSNQKTSVRFHDKKNQLNIVEPFLAYKCDLWWSKDEMNKCRIDVGVEISEYSKEELNRIRNYTDTYHRLRRHATITKQQQQQEQQESSLPSDIMSKSKVVISHDDFQIVVRGKACGWDGLEELLPMNDDAIYSSAENTSEIVRTIVHAYHYHCRQNNKNHSKRKKDIKSNHNSDNNIEDSDRALRSLSKSLTSSDRSWAVIMGTADYDALRLSDL